jgi:hypothetical protein
MEMNNDKLQALTNALNDLKIVGVRPKPEGLSRDLRVEAVGKVATKSMEAIRSLQSMGFYPTRDGNLYSNQGDVVVSTDEGVVYTLRYGEVFLAGGLELSAGTEESSKDAKKKDAKKSEDATENRYLMVTVSFDPSLLPPEHKPEPAPTGPLTIPDDPFQKGPNDPQRIAEEKAEKEKAEREKKEHEKKVGDGKKKVQDLADRFAGWYYVTPGDSFRAIALTPADLVRKKDEKPAGGSPSFPGLPEGGGLPGGISLPPGHPR